MADPPTTATDDGDKPHQQSQSATTAVVGKFVAAISAPIAVDEDDEETSEKTMKKKAEGDPASSVKTIVLKNKNTWSTSTAGGSKRASPPSKKSATAPTASVSATVSLGRPKKLAEQNAQLVRGKDKDKETTAKMITAAIEAPADGDKPTAVKPANQSFADKISRSFFDLTSSSSDRLQRWKSKLHTGGSGSRKSSTTSAERESTAPQRPNDKSSSAAADGGGEKTRRQSSPPAQPRLLHGSRSTNNVLTGVTTATLATAGHLNGVGNAPPYRERKGSEPSIADFAPLLYRHSTVIPHHGGAIGAANAPAVLDARVMDHRTLKARQEWTSARDIHQPSHYQNIVHPAEQQPLPPPARITPFSGVTPQDTDIVRPIAFRPVMVSSASKSSGGADRESMGSSDGRTPTASSYLFNTRPSHTGRQLASADTESAGASAYVVAGGQSTTPNRIQSDLEFSRVIAKPFVTPPTAYVHRPKPIYQPSTSIGGANSSTAASQSYPAKRTDKEKDDDYDSVPEFVDLLKQQLIDNDVYSQHAYQPKQQSSHSSPSSHQNHQHRANNSQMTVGGGSQMQNNSKQFGYPNNTSNTGSFGSRQSSGIHVTPSPSDSGVADFETIIKDKDIELANLRSTMEHNEEIIVRVYQEKEERWQDKLREWSARVDRVNQNEQQLFAQINRLQDERSHLQYTVQNLTAEKQGLQRKCLQIEREMFLIREKLELIATQNSVCKKCGDSLPQFSDLHNGTNLIRSPAQTSKEPSPIPAPRLSKETSKSPSPAVELRGEVDSLRGEVMNLKDTLTGQISLFNDERKRWDEEKNKVLQYQKLLQSNFVHVTERNKKLEETFAALSNNGPINAAPDPPIDRLV